MKKIVPLLFAMSFLFFSLFIALASVRPYAAEVSEEVTVMGELVQVFAIGGETTGWAIKLDKPLEIEGKETRLIEIDMMGKKINLLPFEHQYVRVTGKLVKRHGVERGTYWVIEVEKFETKLITQ